ncbi:MAG: response regulator [Leptospira sp.]|nr:response regulator [Leptospira sp.]
MIQIRHLDTTQYDIDWIILNLPIFFDFQYIGKAQTALSKFGVMMQNISNTLSKIYSPVLKFWIFYFLLLNTPIYAELSENVDYSMKDALYLIEDSESNINWRQPEDIPKNSNWQNLPLEGLKLGFTNQIIWLKIIAENNKDVHQFLMWHLNSNRLLDIQIFEESREGNFKLFELGAKVPQSEIRDPCHGFCHAFTIAPKFNKVFLFRIQSDTAIRIEPKLIQESEFRKSESTENLFFGLYYGFLIAMIIYTVLAYRQMNNTIFLTYVLSLVTILIYYLVFDGQLQRFFLVDYPIFQHSLLSPLGIAYSGSYILFVTSFTKLKTISPKVFRFNIFYIALSFLLCLGGLTIIPNNIMNQIALNWNIFSILIGVVTVAIGADFKTTAGRRFFYGNLSILISGTIFILWWKGYLPGNTITLNSLRIGTIFELMFFTLALGAIIGEIETQRRISSKLVKLRTNFAATLSHEIRTPISAIIGMADVMGETELNQSQAKILESIKSASKFLNTLVNDVLTFTKLDSQNMKMDLGHFRISELFAELDNFFRMRMQEKNINFTLSNECDGDPYIVSDQPKLLQILVNLIGNALKFTPNQGKVYVWANCKKENGQFNIIFKVKDSGIGIPKDRLEIIFEEYEQATDHTSKIFGGTGLGLPISRKLANFLGGKLEVESIENQGSTFSLSINVDEYSGESPNKSDNHLTFNSSGLEKPLLIMHLDDQEEMRLLFSHYFKSSPHSLESFSNSDSALAEYNRKEYDFVFTDFYMPGLNGIEVIEEMRKIDMETHRKPSIKVLCTGSVSYLTNFNNKNTSSKADEVILKPFSKKDIFSLLRKNVT